MAAGLPSGGLPLLAHPQAADMGAPRHTAYRLSGHKLLCGAAAAQGTRQPRRGGPRGARHLQPPGHTPAGTEGSCGHGRRCRDGLGVGSHHAPREARRDGHHFLLVQRGRQRLSRSGAQVSGQGCGLSRQFLCGAQFGGVLRRLIRLHSPRRALSHGAEHLFPHQFGGHGPVRAHAHRC